MQLIIGIYQGEVSLTLRNEGKKISAVSFPEGKNLSEVLLPAIDAMLCQQHITPADLAVVEVTSDLPESFTSLRIAKAVAEGLRSAKE